MALEIFLKMNGRPIRDKRVAEHVFNSLSFLVADNKSDVEEVEAMIKELTKKV